MGSRLPLGGQPFTSRLSAPNNRPEAPGGSPLLQMSFLWIKGEKVSNQKQFFPGAVVGEWEFTEGCMLGPLPAPRGRGLMLYIENLYWGKQ